MESKKLALLCREFAENKKAEDVAVLDVRKISSVTDYFVIASGTSEPHIRAIMNEIIGRLRDEYDIRPKVEGDIRTPWQVLDFFDVIVHVMRADMREKYNLEGLWGDAPTIDAPKAKSKAKTKTAVVKPKKKKASSD